MNSTDIIKDQRIAILSENSSKYAAVIAACWRAGAVVVPLSTRYPESRIKQSLESIACDKLIVSKQYQTIEAGIEKVLIDDIIECDDHEFTVDSFDIANLNLDASIIFTSGSSDTPKAVLHTIGNHYFSALGSGGNIPFGKGDAWLMTLPMYHVSGFSLVMRAMINSGTILFPDENLSIRRCVLDNEFTHISLVPAQLAELLQVDDCVAKLKGLKAILVGGASSSHQLIEKAVDFALPIHTTYGSTEAASQVTTTAPGDVKKHHDTSGKVLQHRQLKISASGEIMIKGKTLFKGYIKGSSIDRAVDDEGYFATGDTGLLDDAGNLYVAGRTDTMFISGGENIYPEHIEKVIEQVDGIEQAIVIGVQCDRFGTRPAAFVKCDGKPDKKAIDQAVRKELEDFMAPVDIFTMPKYIGSGIKPDRKILSQLAEKLILQKDA